MDLVFLAADKPITKRYEKNAKSELIKHPYPFVYEVTSQIETIESIEKMHEAIERHSQQNDCLLKGMINRPLVEESRAGSTNPNDPTEWVCLDFDSVDHYESLDLALVDIGAGDIDYVVQWSSGMGIENAAGFRCHVFMLLDKPHHPMLLKNWLTSLNVNNPILNQQLRLTKTNNSLSFPLDITTCQNDKLLYITPPTLGEGIEDPFESKPRIELCKRGRRTLSIPYPIASKETLRQQIDAKVNDLRVQAGMPKRRASKYKYQGTIEYMQKPDTATVTGTKEERGFVYLNLNGGDSWAYYHPAENPKFIHNFKGEPVYKTEELVPEYWAHLRQQAQEYKPKADEIIYLAFRDFRTSNYYNGTYDPKTNDLNLAMAKSEKQLRDFVTQHGQMLGEYIPDWDLIWDPHMDTVVDSDGRKLNIYQPSDYYKNKPYKAVKQIPATIHKVINHALNHDPQTLDHFLNWLACIVQFRSNTGTAWVLQGTQGTGKGVMFHKVITPMLGETNVVAKRMEELESEFTGFMENKFVVFIDEIEAGHSMYHNKITAKLKNLIVEPTISIRRMYAPPYMAKNYSNLIFASNKNQAVEIATDDRRFNVGGFQAMPIKLTATELDVDIPNEIESFFHFLMTYPADPIRARTPLVNQARTNLIEIGRTAMDRLADAILEGDLEFLWDHLPSQPSNLNALMTYKYRAFRDVIVNAVETLDPALTRDDLFTIFDWCVGNTSSSPHKFTATLKHHKITMGLVQKYNRSTPGINVVWNYDATWRTTARAEISNGVI